MNSKANSQCYWQPQSDRERKTGFDLSCCRFGEVAGLVPSTYPLTSRANTCGRQCALDNVRDTVWCGASDVRHSVHGHMHVQELIDEFEHKNWLQLS